MLANLACRASKCSTFICKQCQAIIVCCTWHGFSLRVNYNVDGIHSKTVEDTRWSILVFPLGQQDEKQFLFSARHISTAWVILLVSITCRLQSCHTSSGCRHLTKLVLKKTLYNGPAYSVIDTEPHIHHLSSEVRTDFAYMVNKGVFKAKIQPISLPHFLAQFVLSFYLPLSFTQGKV